MKNLITVFLLSVCSFQMSFGQNIDQATLTKIKVKLLNAEKLYEQGEYSAVLDKIKEIEAISGGMQSSKIQNLKVKAYLGAKMFQQSKDELNKLYKMNPDDDVIEDIASYESKIDNGIAEEKAKKERARLAAIEREEQARLAEVRRKEDARLADVRRKQMEREENEKQKEKLRKFQDWYKNKYGDTDVNVFYRVQEGKGYRLVNKDMEVLLPWEHQIEPVLIIGNIYAIYGQFPEKGLIDASNAKVILEPNYKFENGEMKMALQETGLAPIYSYKDKKYGYIDKHGKTKIPFKFDSADPFSEGFAVFGENNEKSYFGIYYGYINIQGDIISPAIWQYSKNFHEGLAAVKNKEDDWGYINTNGRLVIKTIYASAGDFVNGRASVKKGKKTYYINKEGKKVN